MIKLSFGHYFLNDLIVRGKFWLFWSSPQDSWLYPRVPWNFLHMCLLTSTPTIQLLISWFIKLICPSLLWFSIFCLAISYPVFNLTFLNRLHLIILVKLTCLFLVQLLLLFPGNNLHQMVRFPTGLVVTDALSTQC